MVWNISRIGQVVFGLSLLLAALLAANVLPEALTVLFGVLWAVLYAVGFFLCRYAFRDRLLSKELFVGFAGVTAILGALFFEGALGGWFPPTLFVLVYVTTLIWNRRAPYRAWLADRELNRGQLLAYVVLLALIAAGGFAL